MRAAMPKYKAAPEPAAAPAVSGLQYSMAGGLAAASAVSGGMVMMQPHMAMAGQQPAVSVVDAASQLQMLQQQQLQQLQRPGLMPGMGLPMQQIAMQPAVSMAMGMPAMAGVPGIPGLVTQPQVHRDSHQATLINNLLSTFSFLLLALR